MALFAVELTYYMWKYEARDWQHLRGVETMKKQEVLIHAKEIEEAYPGLIEKASMDPSKYEHFEPKFSKRTSHLNLGETSRPW